MPKNGAKVYEETKVVDVKPLNGKADGSDGYEVTTECSSSWFHKQRRTWRVRNVVFSASSLGTQEMLFRLKQSGSLPNISDDLGNRVRTNAESILGVRFGKDVDMSKGLPLVQVFTLTMTPTLKRHVTKLAQMPWALCVLIWRKVNRVGHVYSFGYGTYLPSIYFPSHE